MNESETTSGGVVPPTVSLLRRRRRWSVQGVVRWLHLYVSMVGFLAMLFFAVTGITLNHPDWFGESSRTTSYQGTLDTNWLGRNETAPVDRLAIVEYLRATHGLRGMVKDFTEDEEECSIAMNGPGYSADTIVNRSDATYDVTVVEHGTIAIWNDLHKGRDTGRAWSWAIDISALVMAISCVTGLAMLMFMKRKRWSGSLWAAIGGTLFLAVIYIWVK